MEKPNQKKPPILDLANECGLMVDNFSEIFTLLLNFRLK